MYNAGCVASVTEITTCTNDSWPCPSKICSKCFLEFPEVLPVVLSIILQATLLKIYYVIIL